MSGSPWMKVADLLEQPKALALWVEGYVMLPRALFRSELWRSLTAEQRSVVVALWALANFRASGFHYASEWIDVDRGELAHSLATIAEQARVSVKVVRTTLRRLQAGSPSDGIGPLAGTRRGTASGWGPRVVSLLQYEPSRPGADAPGTTKGKPAGTAGARRGHSRGTERNKEAGNQLPGRWWENAELVRPEEARAFLAERERLCSFLDKAAPFEETRWEGSEVPEVRKLRIPAKVNAEIGAS